MTNARNFFTLLGNNKPFLKMALEGFSGTGKTFTSVQIALGLHKYIKSNKPIVCYDTERALKALKPKFSEAGVEIYVRESRSLADLNKTIDYCVNDFSDILIIDSITHVWETLVETYRKEKKRTFIQFQDWGILKPKWKKEFSDILVQSNLHIIFTGRAGYEYGNEFNEDTQKKELIKTGIKMKVENETEYEPDIVVLMEKIKELEGGSLKKIKRQALIIKDRTDTIDGQTFIEPTFENFLKPIQILLDGKVNDSKISENLDTFKSYEEEIYKNKNKREIILEEIQGIFTQMFPGVSAREKKAKIDLLENTFNTQSWKQVESFPLNKLDDGLKILKIKKEKILSLIKGYVSAEVEVDWIALDACIKENLKDIEALPLAGGLVTFYKDQDGTVPKDVFKLSGGTKIEFNFPIEDKYLPQATTYLNAIKSSSTTDELKINFKCAIDFAKKIENDYLTQAIIKAKDEKKNLVSNNPASERNDNDTREVTSYEEIRGV